MVLCLSCLIKLYGGEKMIIIFYLLSLFFAVMGINVMLEAQSVFQEVAGLLVLLMAVVFLVGGAVIGAISSQGKKNG